MYINVLIETKVKSNDMTFTYHVPNNLISDLIGKRVLVPFSNRIVEAFVIEETIKPDNYEENVFLNKNNLFFLLDMSHITIIAP